MTFKDWFIKETMTSTSSIANYSLPIGMASRSWPTNVVLQSEENPKRKKKKIFAQPQVKESTSNNLDECTAVATTINDNILMAKNRDRTYNPTLKIVREILNGTEVIYMYDMKTDYSEGMNEHGFGILNTTLEGKDDEEAQVNFDGYVARHSLSFDNLNKIIKSLTKTKNGIYGHTLIGHKDGYVAIEKIKERKPKIHFFEKNHLLVRTNHGIYFPVTGYQSGKDRESSIYRMFYANKAAKNSQKPDDLLVSMRSHDGNLGYLEPYRTNYEVWTSSQIMLNLSKLEMTFIVDENTKFMGVENRLPDNYTPKIKLNLQKVTTEFKAHAIDNATIKDEKLE